MTYDRVFAVLRGTFESGELNIEDGSPAWAFRL
jgi:hypothetical protein